MKTISKITLLTDFSEVSGYATTYALQIAKLANAKVQIMHVINTPVDWVKIPLENEKLYPETKAEIGMAKFKLGELAKEFGNQGVVAKPSLVYNLGVEDIAGHIKSSDTDLIIMGAHGQKGTSALNIGSNTNKVLRNVAAPTLVVKTGPKDVQVKNMVFASTFEEDQKPAFKKAEVFAKIFGADLHLLNIITPFNFYETSEIDKRLHHFCKECETTCKSHVYIAKNEVRGIHYFLENNKMDILSIVTSGKSGFVQIFSPSLTESLIKQLDIPILSIHK